MACCQLSRFFFCQAGMKQSEHSDTTDRSNLESSVSSKSNRLTALGRKIMKGTFIILSVAFFITVYVLANRRNRNSYEYSEFVPTVNSQSLEVEVLDGAGSMRAAQQMTDVLRAQGYDVVEMKNNGEVEERTFIIDRSGKLDAARRLATALGISRDRVFQKIDRTLYLDITVVLGKDYSRLKAFQSSTERNVH